MESARNHHLSYLETAFSQGKRNLLKLYFQHIDQGHYTKDLQKKNMEPASDIAIKSSLNLPTPASLPTNEELRGPPPPPDGGLLAWKQVAAGFCIFFITWELIELVSIA